MATFRNYTCSNCGFEIMTAATSKFVLMSGIYKNFLCQDCKSLHSIRLASTGEPEQMKCDECGSERLTVWNPTTGACPKCGNKLSEDEDKIILAD